MRRVGGLLLVVLVACTGLLGATASAGAEVRPVSEGGLSFGTIHGPTDPEEYSFSLELSEELELRQIDDRHVGVYYSSDGLLWFTLVAEEAHDAQGATVPTTLVVTAPEVVTLTVYHREGNPAAGGAPFEYPIIGGAGWEGGFRTITFPLTEPHPAPAVASPASATTEPSKPERVLVTRALGEDKLYYRPHFFLLSGDGTFGVSKVHWTSYGGPVAEATGKGFANDCIPYCAAGHFYKPQAKLRLSKIVQCKGQPVYARLRYELAGKLPKNFPRRGGYSMLPLGENGKPDC
jgi:hypothetical protein